MAQQDTETFICISNLIAHSLSMQDATISTSCERINGSIREAGAVKMIKSEKLPNCLYYPINLLLP